MPVRSPGRCCPPRARSLACAAGGCQVANAGNGPRCRVDRGWRGGGAASNGTARPARKWNGKARASGISAGRRSLSRGHGGLGLLQLLHLEHDHGFVDGLEQGVGEAGTAVEEAALEHVEQQELDQGAGGQAVEELLLVEAAAVEVALEEGGR